MTVRYARGMEPEAGAVHRAISDVKQRRLPSCWRSMTRVWSRSARGRRADGRMGMHMRLRHHHFEVDHTRSSPVVGLCSPVTESVSRVRDSDKLSGLILFFEGRWLSSLEIVWYSSQFPSSTVSEFEPATAALLAIGR